MTGELLVECRGLTLGYDEEPILRGIDLAVERGEILGIIGGSGSGKSTLLRAMVGLLPPSAGTVLLLGRDLYALDVEARDELLARTGMLFQHDALFGSLTLIDNVALPLRELTDLPDDVAAELARVKLGLVGLAGLERRYPGDISGGQRKRAGLARACVLDPAVVFCDEPTAGLDPIMASQLDHVMLDFRNVFGITIVAVTHDVASLRAICDRAIMLSEGEICAQGKIAELEASDQPYVRRFMSRSIAV